MTFANNVVVPVIGTLRAKRGSLEMEVVDHANGVFAILKGHAGRGAVKELGMYLTYLMALKPLQVTFDVSWVSCLADPALDVLEGFRRQIAQGGGEVTFTGLTSRLAGG